MACNGDERQPSNTKELGRVSGGTERRATDDVEEGA